MNLQLVKTSNNPFWGMKNCLRLMSASVITTEQLDAAWEEVRNDVEKRKMFFSLLFSIGDITNRQHNLFGKQVVDNGGNAKRENFYNIFLWIKDTNPTQFVEFLNAGLFNEYQCFDTLFRSRVVTNRNNGLILHIYDVFADSWYCNILSDYLVKVINSNNPFNKMLIAKFLTIPRLSKRKGHNKMQEKTKEVMRNKQIFLKLLSDKMDWKYIQHGVWIDFVDYKNWRKQYNGELESVMFSTKKIVEFGKQEFIEWLDKLPAIARSRVENRIRKDQLKWPSLYYWYFEWEQFKNKKQQELRTLKEKIRQGIATEDETAELKQLEREAKVNIGANTFEQLYNDICNGNVDKLKLEAFVDKINLPYNSLVIIDDSGSMNGAPFNFATFLAAVCLYKNPDDDARNLLGFFNSWSHWHTYIDKKCLDTNRWIRRIAEHCKPTPFINPEKSFYENYLNIKSFCYAVYEGGCTRIDQIVEGLHKVCKQYPEVLDSLKSYPIWTILSDGEWNNKYSPEASMNVFMSKCQQYFGFKPFIVAIDINDWYRNGDATRFAGIDNMIYINNNVAQIEQFLTNFKDSDVFDVYNPLQALYRTNRYEPVRRLVF